MTIAKERFTEIYKLNPSYIIEAINIALKDSTQRLEDSEEVKAEFTGTLTKFTFIYADDSELTIDTCGQVKTSCSDSEYWVY